MPAVPPLALPIGPNRLAPLDEAGLEAIHRASLEVLKRTGVVVPSARVRARLSAAGARVDDAGRARFPAGIVEEAIARAPASYTLAGREPALDLPLDGAHGWLSVDGSAAEILDLDTGERRPSTAADLTTVTRLADALPEIGFLWQGERKRATSRSPSGRCTSCGSS